MSENSTAARNYYGKVRVLTNHDVLTLEVGDAVDLRGDGVFHVVKNYQKRTPRKGEPSRTITLSNGYVFDPTMGPFRPAKWANVTILRPLRKFVPSGEKVA